MRHSLLEILSCPFCGSRMVLVEAEPNLRDGDELEVGVLACECFAYPLVGGIPVISTGYYAETALEQIKQGQFDAAFDTMLDLDAERAQAFHELAGSNALTYRNAIAIFCPDGE